MHAQGHKQNSAQKQIGSQNSTQSDSDYGPSESLQQASYECRWVCTAIVKDLIAKFTRAQLYIRMPTAEEIYSLCVR